MAPKPYEAPPLYVWFATFVILGLVLGGTMIAVTVLNVSLDALVRAPAAVSLVG
jgi:hypothetical protein